MNGWYRLFIIFSLLVLFLLVYIKYEQRLEFYDILKPKWSQSSQESYYILSPHIRLDDLALAIILKNAGFKNLDKLDGKKPFLLPEIKGKDRIYQKWITGSYFVNKEHYDAVSKSCKIYLREHFLKEGWFIYFIIWLIVISVTYTLGLVFVWVLNGFDKD